MKLKLNTIKVDFPLCQPIWALALTLSISLAYSSSICRALSRSWRESERDLWNLLSSDWFNELYQLLKGPGLTQRLQRSLRLQHTPLLTNQLINIAMETKWQEIAFHQAGAVVIISWHWFLACSPLRFSAQNRSLETFLLTAEFDT